METKYSHTLNPATGREVTINGVRFNNLLKHGYKYNAELNRLYEDSLPPDTTVYIPKSRVLSPNNRSMIIGGSAYYELIRDHYRRQGGKWVKMSKEEAEAYDNDPNIECGLVNPDSDTDSGDTEYPVDIDEFEYDEDGHAIFPF